ncbi:MAG: phosphonoacetaldehyde hydrolase [Isosphaeraceae bacterium]|nr:phosphonoacetaldehyde hydrolase [Isosphaeraceae bacterium]
MSRSSRGLQAVFFDWAGTTVDHGSRAPVVAFVEIFRRSGVEITLAEAREPMGRAKRDHIATILAMPRVASAWRDRFHADATEADIDRLYVDFLPLQKEVIARHCDVIEGVPAVVAELRRRGLQIGSSTGYTRELMDVVVPIAASLGYSPDVDLGADDVAEGRPAPWLNFRIAERLGVYPLSEVVVVDDTPVGIRAGLNAGAWTVAVTRTGNALGLSAEEAAALAPDDRAQRLATAEAAFREVGAHFVLESAADLIPVIDEIERRLAAGERP